jgi:hypothetical protein
LGRGGGNHVGNKEELVNPSAVICDGREQAMVQKAENVIEHMQSLHATIHVGNSTKESKGKRPATAKKGTGTYKRRPRTDKSEQISNSMTLEVGNKRGADVDGMCIDEEVLSVKKSKGNGGSGGGMIDAGANVDVGDKNFVKTGLSE